MLSGIRRKRVSTPTTNTLRAVVCRDTKPAFFIGGGLVKYCPCSSIKKSVDECYLKLC